MAEAIQLDPDEPATSDGNKPRAARPLQLGLMFHGVETLARAVDHASGLGVTFVAVPLVHPRYRRAALRTRHLPHHDWPLTRSDMELQPEQWSNNVVGCVSTWLQLDSRIEATRQTSEAAFAEEVAWAGHLGLSAVLLPAPMYPLINYARCINSAIVERQGSPPFWIRIPMVKTAGPTTKPIARIASGRASNDMWTVWNTLKSLCEHSPALGVALELTSQLPDLDVQDLWLAEPIRCVLVPTHVFLINAAGYPVLPKALKRFVVRLFRHCAHYLITGPSRCEGELDRYIGYLEAIHKDAPPLTDIESLLWTYNDYLQNPLQPLQFNLESATYAVFERDPVKYKQYEKAVAAALRKKLEQSPGRVVVMVVGAGRGPLVTASIVAGREVGCTKVMQIYAVEKNPNAIVTLRNLKMKLGWGERVQIVHSDMRVWQAPEKADIMVSELLGSFGDNELSPECLDGAQVYLKSDGISIPTSYTSFMAPMSSSKLWNEVRAFNDVAHFETSYVVRLHTFSELDEPQPVFKFTHPNPDAIQPVGQGVTGIARHNERMETLVYHSRCSAMLYGFTGYFDCDLYDGIRISILPATESKGMFSWFPLYFPIREPMFVEKGQAVELTMWRRVSSLKVWYEWLVTSPEVSKVHNPNGRSHWMGL